MSSPSLRILAVALVALALLPAPSSAQDDPAQPTSGARPAAEPLPPPVAQPAVQAASGVSFDVALTGLDAANKLKVHDAVAGMTRRLFVCDTCGHESQLKEACPACNKPLAPQHVPMAARVEADPVKGLLHLTLPAGQSLRLSEIAAALADSGAHPDPARQAIPGDATLLVKGVADAASRKLLVGRIERAELFASVHSEFVRSQKLVALTVTQTAGEPAVTEGQLAELIQADGSGFRLADVGWGPHLIEATPKKQPKAAPTKPAGAKHKKKKPQDGAPPQKPGKQGKGKGKGDKPADGGR